MDLDSEAKLRPTIRIEIQNDVVEPMDISTQEDDIEDGEVSDEEETKDHFDPESNARNQQKGSKWMNKEGGFSTGIDIFDKDEQEKLQSRAERFGISQDESQAINEQQLQELYVSLNIEKNDKNVRFEAVHIRGVEEMSTKDVFGYFNAYGPFSIEWINDYTCNAVWLDNVSASRALLGLSKKIKGLEFQEESNPFIAEHNIFDDNAPEPENPEPTKPGRSILLIEPKVIENSVVSLKNLAKKIEVQDDDGEDCVNASEITIPIPPGYWRFGNPHPKAKTLLLRFALRTDRKPLHAEKMSTYYKKYGNPNFGGLRGIITESKKRRLRGQPEVINLRTQSNLNNDESKNPWGSLAQHWNREDRGIVSFEPKEEVYPVEKNVRVTENKPGKSILQRIGIKRNIAAVEETYSNDESESDEEKSVKIRKKAIPRMRMYADEEEARITRLKEMKKRAQPKLVVDRVDGPLNLRMSIENDRFGKSTSKIDVRSRLGQVEKRRADLSSRLGQKNIESTRNSIRSRLGKVLPQERIEELDESDLEVENYDDEEPVTFSSNRQKSMVKVVVRNPPKPTMPSTIVRRNEPTKLSEREHFRSKESGTVKDLRSKISTVDSRRKQTLQIKVKKEVTSSEESSSSDSEDTASDSNSINVTVR